MLIQSLHELLKSRKTLSEIETKHIIREILLGLQYLKSMKIVHRDIKVGNIMLTHGLDVKIGDFGLAAYYPEEIFQKYSTVCILSSYQF